MGLGLSVGEGADGRRRDFDEAEVTRLGARPDGAGDLGTPDGAALVELAFFLDEGGRVSLIDPDVDIVGLLADDGGNEAGDAADDNVGDEVGGLATAAADGEGVAAGRDDGEVDHAGLFAGGEQGEAGDRGGGADVHNEWKAEAVGEIGGEVEVRLADLLLAVGGGGLVGDAAGGDVDEHVHGVWVGGAALDVVIAEEVEGGVLGVGGGLVVEGAVAEVEDEMGLEAAVALGLGEVSGGEVFTVEGGEGEEDVSGALGEADGDGGGRQGRGDERGEQGEEDGAEERGDDGGTPR